MAYAKLRHTRTAEMNKKLGFATPCYLALGLSKQNKAEPLASGRLRNSGSKEDGGNSVSLFNPFYDRNYL